MKKVDYRLNKDEIERIKYLKKEFSLKLLKSIINNNQTKPYIRMYATYRLQKTFVSKSFRKNFCLKTGKAGSVYRHFNMSRHQINLYAKMGLLPNVKSNNIK